MADTANDKNLTDGTFTVAMPFGQSRIETRVAGKVINYLVQDVRGEAITEAYANKTNGFNIKTYKDGQLTETRETFIDDQGKEIDLMLSKHEGEDEKIVSSCLRNRDGNLLEYSSIDGSYSINTFDDAGNQLYSNSVTINPDGDKTTKDYRYVTKDSSGVGMVKTVSDGVVIYSLEEKWGPHAKRDGNVLIEKNEKFFDKRGLPMGEHQHMKLTANGEAYYPALSTYDNKGDSVNKRARHTTSYETGHKKSYQEIDPNGFESFYQENYPNGNKRLVREREDEGLKTGIDIQPAMKTSEYNGQGQLISYDDSKGKQVFTDTGALKSFEKAGADDATQAKIQQALENMQKMDRLKINLMSKLGHGGLRDFAENALSAVFPGNFRTPKDEKELANRELAKLNQMF